MSGVETAPGLDVVLSRNGAPWAAGEGGWPCAEGDRIGVHTRSGALPSARVNGQALALLSLQHADGAFRAGFEMVIDTWAGRTTLAVAAGAETRRFLLDVRPNATKQTGHEFDAMLAELAELSPHLPWGLSPGAGAGTLWAASDAPAVVHPAVIAGQLPLLLPALARFLADPPVVVRRAREVRPFDAARRVDPGTARWLTRHPAALAALRAPPPGASSPGASWGGPPPDGAPPAPRVPVEQPARRPSLAHPVTRHVLSLLLRLRPRFAATAGALRGAGGQSDQARAHARELAEQVARAEEAIGRALRAPLFRGLDPAPATETVVQALADAPPWAVLHRAAHRLLHPGLAWTPGEGIDSALKHGHDLFELLVLHRLYGWLRDRLGPGWRWRAPVLGEHGAELRPADGATWTACAGDGRRVALCYRPAFPRAAATPDPRERSSLSGRLVPDYTLVAHEGDAVRSWLVLDAKYRSSRRNVDDALRSAHLYRDALRVRGTAAAGAYIVVPRLREPELAYARDGYGAHHRFGVRQLYLPGCFDPVGAWLDGLGRPAGEGTAAPVPPAASGP